MFKSEISVKNLVDELISEVDIALPIPNKTYVAWLNSLQQLIYTEIIKEQRKVEMVSSQNPIDISSIKPGTDEANVRFEDIYTIYADDVQLIRTTLTSGVIFPYTYYKDNNNIGYSTDENNTQPSKLTIVYIVRPALITVDEDDNIDDSKVMFPEEFIDIAKSKLRGEAYKLANEDLLASKWLNDYNVLLETFKVWIAEKTANLGM